MRTLNKLRWMLPAAAMAGVCIATAQQTKKVDNNALRKPSADEWVTYGHDYAETHFSPLKQIDASNVKRLGLAWKWQTESPAGANVATTPLVSNGVMYGS